MKDNFFWQRVCMYIAGIFLMGCGVALSCRADLGTSPISSVPWVLSMFTPFSVGMTTIVMNLVFIAVQPLILRAVYWRELIGQLITLLFFGNGIDFFMDLLAWYNPETLWMKWAGCLLGTVVLALGVFLCVHAKIFVAAGEGVVLAISFAFRKKFGLIKNCFDITLVIISLIISYAEFGAVRGVGIGTIAAAILVGRFVQLFDNRLTFFNRWKIK